MPGITSAPGIRSCERSTARGSRKTKTHGTSGKARRISGSSRTCQAWHLTNRRRPLCAARRARSPSRAATGERLRRPRRYREAAAARRAAAVRTARPSTRAARASARSGSSRSATCERRTPPARDPARPRRARRARERRAPREDKVERMLHRAVRGLLEERVRKGARRQHPIDLAGCSRARGPASTRSATALGSNAGSRPAGRARRLLHVLLRDVAAQFGCDRRDLAREPRRIGAAQPPRQGQVVVQSALAARQALRRHMSGVAEKCSRLLGRAAETVRKGYVASRGTDSDRHERLDVPRLARALLPREAAAARVARVLRGTLSDRRAQRHDLPAAEGARYRALVRRAARFVYTVS